VGKKYTAASWINRWGAQSVLAKCRDAELARVTH